MGKAIKKAAVVIDAEIMEMNDKQEMPTSYLDVCAPNKRAFLEALILGNGLVLAASNATGINFGNHYRWLKEDAEYKAMVDEIQEIAIDFVESKLFEKINGVAVRTGIDKKTGEDIIYDQAPSDTAIIFFLKTRAKKRGYVERQELTGAEGGPINTNQQHEVVFRKYGVPLDENKET